jgi:hypothetical protein
MTSVQGHSPQSQIEKAQRVASLGQLFRPIPLFGLMNLINTAKRRGGVLLLYFAQHHKSSTRANLCISRDVDYRGIADRPGWR